MKYLGYTSDTGVTTDRNTIMPPNAPGGYVINATAAPTPTVVLTPTSGAIPPPNVVPSAAVPAASSWFTSSRFGGIPNWALLGGAVVLLMGGKR